MISMKLIEIERKPARYHESPLSDHSCLAARGANAQIHSKCPESRATLSEALAKKIELTS
jgi:hypothetical protein